MPNPVAAAGLAFALTLTDGGRALTTDRFVLRTPGLPGAVVLELEDPDLYGSTFATPVRIKNDTPAELLGVSVEVVSVTETRKGTEGKEEGRVHAGGEGQPPAWDSIPKDAETSAQLLRAGPVSFGDETLYVIVLGRVHGVAALGGFSLEEAPSPDALEVDAGGTLYVHDAGGKVVRTDGEGKRPVATGKMPVVARKPSTACAALGDRFRFCREGPDGSLWTADAKDLTRREPDGKARSFPTGGDGAPTAIAFGREGRVYVATAGAEGRRGSVRVFRPF